MARKHKNNHLFRGLLQSEDGLISKVIDTDRQSITFEAVFGLSDELIDQLKSQPEHIVFSERSRIARLGIQIKCEPPGIGDLAGDQVALTLVASSVIPGYPGLDEIKDFFSLGLPVGRLVFCDPDDVKVTFTNPSSKGRSSKLSSSSQSESKNKLFSTMFAPLTAIL